MELDTASFEPGGLTRRVNKRDHVTTINRVAEELGEDEDLLRDVVDEMETEDGCIRAYGIGENGTLAFTDFGIENIGEFLIGPFVRSYKDDPDQLKRPG